MTNKSWIVSSLFLVVGLVGCVQPQDAAPSNDEASTESTADQALGGGGICSIDYLCPTTGEEFTGFKNGGTGPGGAAIACDRRCDVPCTTDGWFCE